MKIVVNQNQMPGFRSLRPDLPAGGLSLGRRPFIFAIRMASTFRLARISRHHPED